MYLFSELSFLPFLLLLGLWTGGGAGLLRGFDLSARERLPLGLGLGLTVSTLLANWLGRVLPTEAAFWLAAALPCLAWLPVFGGEKFKTSEIRPALTGMAALLVSAFFFTLLGRGLGIFDDYQNLPQVSSLALGDLPPHFAYAPTTLWSYHYFLPLVAAQITRLAAAAPWVSMDAARGLSLALTLFYAGFWAWRKTGSQAAAALTAAFLYLAGGARWLLWLLPASALEAVSRSVTLIGSGAGSGETLKEALYNVWKIQGQPPLNFPFAFGSGLDPSLALAHAGYGVSGLMLVLLILLLAGRGNGKKAETWLLMILLAAMALANEVTFALLYAGLGLAAALTMILRRSWRVPAQVWQLFPALAGGLGLALLQGGVLSGAALNLLGRLRGAAGEQALYQVSFALRAPILLSAHLGELSVLNPLQWPAILAETGLALAALPWLAAWGWSEFRQADSSSSSSKTAAWLEAGWLASILPAFLTVFLAYTGNAGPTALSRITAHGLLVVKMGAVAALWQWTKNRAETWRIAAGAWGLAACLSGLVLFAFQLSGAPNPARAEFLGVLDAEMWSAHWGRLESSAWVFDTSPARATTTLGLHTASGDNYGPPNSPQFLALLEKPDPQALAAAGYRYLYLDETALRDYAPFLKADCVKTLDERSLTDSQGKLLERRALLDVGACQNSSE